jgi:hypothetical protein
MEKTKEKTTITVSNKLWKTLSVRRTNSKETMEQVIWRLIKNE